MKIIKHTAFVGLATVGVLTITPASAETIFLKCGQMAVFTVDLTKNTVDNRPANITPVTMEWETTGLVGQSNDGETFTTIHQIDRTSGVYTENVTIHLTNGRNLQIPPTTLSCSPQSAPPPTKF